ncbi:MAG: hypothetical protein DRP59_12740 [Spirochaetes bacterium]|nr:MAG: hypothetical protein DRP59_12740 [Spirochaetota bacterium]
MRRMILRPRELYRFLFKKGRGVGLVLLLWTFSSCGIDSYPVLYEPVVTSISSTSPITFSHDSRNDPDSFLVLGYDIYYRIYNDDNLDPFSYDDQIKNDAALELTETVIGNLLNRNWNQMKHYRRIYLSDAELERDTPPSFPLSAATTQNFFISLYLDGTNSYIKNDFDTSQTLYFSRYLGNDAAGVPVTENFSLLDFSTDDPDIFEPASHYRVAFFALTYGLTTDTALHSSVLYIGSYRF